MHGVMTQRFEEVEEKIESRKIDIIKLFNLSREEPIFGENRVSIYDMLNSSIVSKALLPEFASKKLKPGNVDHGVLSQRHTQAFDRARQGKLQNTDATTSNIIQDILILGKDILKDPRQESYYCEWLKNKHSDQNDEVEALRRTIASLSEELKRAQNEKRRVEQVFENELNQIKTAALEIEQKRQAEERARLISQERLEEERKEKERLQNELDTRKTKSLHKLQLAEWAYDSILKARNRLRCIPQKETKRNIETLPKALGCVAILSILAISYWYKSNLVSIKGEPVYKVALNDLPVYEYPMFRNLKISPVQTVKKNTQLRLIRSFSGASVEWVEISLTGSPKVIGWVERNHTIRVTPFPLLTGTVEFTLSKSGRVRKEPNANSAIILALEKGDIILALPEDYKSDVDNSEWQKVQHKPDKGYLKEGWMNKRIIFE